MICEQPKTHHRPRCASLRKRWATLVLLCSFPLLTTPSLAAPSLTEVQVWRGSHSELKTFFAHIRDTKIFADPEIKGTHRRIPWNEPETCFIRAEAVRREALRLGKAEPSKLFIHGAPRIGIKNRLDPNRRLSWKYHVVAAYRIVEADGSESVFILDPSTFPSAPARIEHWLLSLEGGATATLDACAPETYGIHDHCEKPRPPGQNTYWNHPSLTFEAYMREALRLERNYLRSIDEQTGSSWEKRLL